MAARLGHVSTRVNHTQQSVTSATACTCCNFVTSSTLQCCVGCTESVVMVGACLFLCWINTRLDWLVGLHVITISVLPRLYAPPRPPCSLMRFLSDKCRFHGNGCKGVLTAVILDGEVSYPVHPTGEALNAQKGRDIKAITPTYSEIFPTTYISVDMLKMVKCLIQYI